MFSLFKFILNNVNLALMLFYILILPVLLFIGVLFFFNTRISDSHIAVALSIGVVLFYSLITSLFIILRKLKNISNKIDNIN